MEDGRDTFVKQTDTYGATPAIFQPYLFSDSL